MVELKALEDWVVERQMRTVPGVVDVNGFGGPTKQYQVLIDPAKLRSYNLSLSQVLNALSNGNRNGGGSYIEHGPEMYIVRGLGFVKDTADIARDRRGHARRHADPHQRSWTRGDRRAASARARRQKGARPARRGRRGAGHRHFAQRRERARSAQGRPRSRWRHQQELPPAGRALVTHYDRTDLIDRTLHTVRHNMIEGIVLVLLVLILFLGLGNFRSALVVAAVVPLSLLGAFLLLDLRGIPANLISMGAIDFGIIVDSAVVVIENLLRLLETRASSFQNLPAAIIEAVAQMGGRSSFRKSSCSPRSSRFTRCSAWKGKSSARWR
jgi:cobalt-zinc-cadmium resistance protein CzcA